MATVRKTVTFTHKQDAWIKAQVEEGEYTNDSEYLRALVRRHQAESLGQSELKAAIMEGFESGLSKETVDSIWAKAEARHKLENE